MRSRSAFASALNQGRAETMDISDTTKLVQTADALVGLYDGEKRAREAAEARIAERERERNDALNQLDKIAAARGMQDADDDMAEEIAKHTRERAEREAKLAEAHGTV